MLLKLRALSFIWYEYCGSSSLPLFVNSTEKLQMKTATALLTGVFDGIFLLTLLHLAVYLRIYGEGRLLAWDMTKSRQLHPTMLAFTYAIAALVAANGVGVLAIAVEGEHHDRAVELLKAACGSVIMKLVVRHNPKLWEEMQKRIDQQRRAAHLKYTS